MKLSSLQVMGIIEGANIDSRKFQLADRDWHTCSESFCHGNWSAWLQSLPNELKEYRNSIQLPKWIAECFDCDNHSIGTFQHAQVGNALKEVRTAEKRGGLLYGILFYHAVAKPENGRQGGHAINWFIDHEGKLRFFESAEDRVIELYEEERRSAWFGFAA